MIQRTLVVLFVLLPAVALAQGNFSGYRATTLDAVFEDWNAITRNDGPGVSFRDPEKIRFVATLKSAPRPCSNAALETVLRMMNFADLLKQVSVTHCIGFTSPKGRNAVAYVQDVLVPGLNKDAKVGGPVEFYVDFLAYLVDAARSRNLPILLVSRFEPQ
jgi:hypothetical protein